MSNFKSPNRLFLAEAKDEEVSAFFRCFLPDFYFVNTPLSRMRRHLELLRELPVKPLQIEFHAPPGAPFTELVLCAHDQIQPGLLARVAHVLARLKINVHTAWIHTLRDPNAPGRMGALVVLNTLLISENYFARARPLTPRTRATIEAQLRAVFQSSQTHRFTAATSRAVRELCVTEAPPYTLIQVSAPNETGVLHRVAQSVASLNLNIAHAQINTFEETVSDTFFVTGAQTEGESRRTQIAAQLRELLNG